MMGFFDSLFSRPKTDLNDENQEFDIKGEKVKVLEIGSSGTEIFAGYLTEEYLRDLNGRDAADIFDRMRRSDPKIKMIVNAMKNPIVAANWEIVGLEEEETRSGEIQRKLIEHILFSDLGKTWDRFVREALSMIEFGYSLFEVTYKAELNDPVFGSYNGIKSLAFRSQRTVERWNIKRSGELDSVEQQAFGDKQKVVNIPAEFLLHFAIDMEGDNFEGISILRPAYGPFLRKNQFLKLLAAGVEKYAIPIPTLSIPAGKENTAEYTRARSALAAYVSNRCNYMTIPDGWDLKLTTNNFDAEKIRKVINDENSEMVNAALANFLELGQSGSGSYALGTDLSDFFLGGLEYIADQIAETINNVLIPKLVKLNFPDGIVRCELRHSGIRDKAGEELANVVTSLVSSGVVVSDDRLETSLRKRFGLPEKEESTTRENEEGVPSLSTSSSEVSETISDESIKDLSLNGAQVTAIVQVVKSFKEGVIDKQSATELIVTAFPIPRDVAERIVGEEISREELEEISTTQLSEKNESIKLANDQKKKPSKTQKKTKGLIDRDSERLSQIYKKNLDVIQNEMIERVKRHFETSSESQKFKISLDDLKSVRGIGDYKKELKEELSRIYNDSIKQAKRENPRYADIKMSEFERNIRLAEADKLNPTAKRRVNSDLENILSVQVDDLAKSISLQYAMSVESTDSANTIGQDIKEASDKKKNLATSTGAIVQTAKTINDARRDFFGEFKEEIESFTWINEDPVSTICSYLTGRTLPADHPDVERYWPPLHHNCKTYVIANTKRTKENPPTQDGFKPNKKELASITLAEKTLDDIDTTPPKSAQNNAKKVLKWRDEHGEEVKGMTQTGWIRANQLASGKPLSIETIKRMASFKRHEKNADVDPKFKDEPWKDNGLVAWLGWGGSTGVNWAIEKSKEIDRVRES